MDENKVNEQRLICERDEYYKEITELCDGITNAKFYPYFGETSWQCTCGHENENALENCEKCSVSRDRLKIIFSELFLIQRRSENEIKRKASEKRRIEEDAEKWRRIDPEVENIYNEAQNFEETRDNYLAAAKRLDTIKGYKDSESLAAKYRALAESVPLYDRKTLRERRGKLIKKASVIVLFATAVILAVYATIYFTFIAPDGMMYKIVDGEVTITSYNTFFGGKYAKIPEDIRGRKVTAIGSDAFKNCSALLSVEIPETVTRVEQNAFRGCSSLEAVILPESVTELGPAAFSGCSSLSSVEIYGEIKIIKISTFYDCTELSNLVIYKKPDMVETNAFAGCLKLKIIQFGGTKEEWKSVVVQNGNVYFEEAAKVFEYKSENDIK